MRLIAGIGSESDEKDWVWLLVLFLLTWADHFLIYNFYGHGMFEV